MNNSEITESHKRILLDVFENGQQLIDSWKPENRKCESCDKPATLFLINADTNATSLYEVKGGQVGECIREKETGGYTIHEEYFCDECYDKEDCLYAI